MNDYITKADAVKAACKLCLLVCKNTEVCPTRDAVFRAIHAADVRPVVHGEWWPAKDGYYGHVMCSACHKIESHKTDFCPNCGADMTGGADG